VKGVNPRGLIAGLASLGDRVEESAGHSQLLSR